LEAALAAAALSFLFLSPPSSSATLSVLRTPVVAAAEGASRFSRRLQRAVITQKEKERVAFAVPVPAARSGHPRRRRRVMRHVADLWRSAGLGLWPAHKPPSRQCQHQACICNNNARRAQWLLVVCGMRDVVRGGASF
jgi:hypothetical protein